VSSADVITAADTTIHALQAIALDELVERAALLTRLDRKYILPVGDLPAVLDGLPSDVRVLQIDRRRDFAYRSCYFDTPALDSYLAAARRRRRRFKVRVRSYVESDLRFLEVKTRGQRGITVKQRIPYAGDGRSLTGRFREHTDAVLSDAGIRPERLTFAPTLTTCYRRTTLFVASTGSRVTIDRGLAWSLPDGTTVETPDSVVVETKSAGATSDVDRLLWSLGHRPAGLSKYGTGLAALRPELPANRWRPVLRRHFPTSTEERWS
jgi:hypothetical protein